MPKKLFQKGQAPKSPGRPKGVKDKSYLTLQFWHDELMKDWPKLRPAQRAKLSVQNMQMLVNKMKQLPTDPKESVRNIEQSLEMLEAMEKGKESEVGGSKDRKNEELEPISPPPAKSEPEA